MTSILVLGGARSGKSARAQFLAEQAGTPRLYLATAEPRDDEMRTRIERHRADRDATWETVEEPLDIVALLRSEPASNRIVLVDCLTLWLSNLFGHERDIEAEAEALCAVIRRRHAPLILVSNEIGLGLVPETALGRAFRDAQGRLNQSVASACDRVEFVAAGLPLTLKG